MYYGWRTVPSLGCTWERGEARVGEDPEPCGEFLLKTYERKATLSLRYTNIIPKEMITLQNFETNFGEP